MADPAPNAELMRSLGRLVRGLSALFWGLPITLVACVWTANPHWMKAFGLVPPLLSTGLLVFGLSQLGSFQKQERVWRAALDRAVVLGLMNFFLSPFLFWWSRVPGNAFFTVMVLLLAFSGLLFLGSLNLVLQRLAAMLPDEALRLETRQFTSLNLTLLTLTLLLTVAFFVLAHLERVPLWLQTLALIMERGGLWVVLPIAMLLLPLAMTMALIWKTKEVILENVFGPKQ